MTHGNAGRWFEIVSKSKSRLNGRRDIITWTIRLDPSVAFVFFGEVMICFRELLPRVRHFFGTNSRNSGYFVQ